MARLVRWIRSKNPMIDEEEACKKAANVCEDVLGFDKLSVEAKARLTAEFVTISYNPDDFLPYSSFMSAEGKSTVEKMILEAILSGVRRASHQATQETFDTALKTARPSFYKVSENASQNNLDRKLRIWYEMSMTDEFMSDLIMSFIEPESESDTTNSNTTNSFWLPSVSMDVARSLITHDIVARALGGAA